MKRCWSRNRKAALDIQKGKALYAVFFQQLRILHRHPHRRQRVFPFGNGVQQLQPEMLVLRHGTDARAAQLCELLRVRRSRVVLRPGALFKKALEERAAPQRVAGNGRPSAAKLPPPAPASAGDAQVF